MDNERLLEVHNDFVRVAHERGFYSQELMEKVAKSGSVRGMPEVPADVQKIFTISHLISPEWHIRTQAAFQKYTDNAVSKTVNCPNDATKQDIETIFRLAHTLGCKGVTVYRDGSRDSQVLNLTGKKAVDTVNVKPVMCVTPRERPEITMGLTERVKIGCGNLYVTVNSDDNGICEVFTSLGRNGGCPSQSEATARLISMALRAGIEVQEIIDQLKGIRCMSTIRRASVVKDLKVLSCPDAIGKAIEKYYLAAKDNFKKMPPIFKEKASQKQDLMVDNQDPGCNCPECGSILEHDSGCVICKSCGYSKCG
jgi:ribonucleoside-diphosphate reductase alpha chain